MTGNYSEHFPHTAPPETREAPAHFVRNGLHYLITSGTTGYHPNPEVAFDENATKNMFINSSAMHMTKRSRELFLL